ncbi:hypothetical protein WKT22_00007 [Candidatus Lokiarchaeum ossiferum]
MPKAPKEITTIGWFLTKKFHKISLFIHFFEFVLHTCQYYAIEYFIQIFDRIPIYDKSTYTYIYPVVKRRILNLIENEQIYLIPAKIFEIITYILVLYTLNRKYRGINLRKRPPIHQYFVIGISAWIFYMIFDTIIFVIAPLSISTPLLSESPYQGYLTGYASVTIANILRDIAIFGAICHAWFYCAAAVKIQTGVNLTRKIFGSDEEILTIKTKSLTWGHLAKIFGFIILIAVVYLDQIVINVSDSTIHVSSDWGIGLILILILYTTSTILMFRQLVALRNKPMEAEYKTRAKLLGWSIIIFTIGLYYWGLTGSLLTWLINWKPEIASYSIIFLYLGHFIWMLSGIYVYLAFRDVNKTE